MQGSMLYFGIWLVIMATLAILKIPSAHLGINFCNPIKVKSDMTLNIWIFSLDKTIVRVKKKKEKMNERKNDRKPNKNTNTSLTSFERLKNSWKQTELSIWILYILTFNSLHVYFWQITCNKYIKLQLIAVKFEVGHIVKCGNSSDCSHIRYKHTAIWTMFVSVINLQ